MNGRDLTDPIMEMYIFESSQLLEQLESTILDCEQAASFSVHAINEIFRNMHTLKGSAAMMQYLSIAEVAHAIEDLFHFIRENKEQSLNHTFLSDLVLRVADFIKAEVSKISQGKEPDGNPIIIINDIKQYLEQLKQLINIRLFSYQAVVRFQSDCEMENIRSFNIIHRLKEISEILHHEPTDLLDDERSIEAIRNQGFHISFKSEKSYQEVHGFFMETIFLEQLSLTQIEDAEDQELFPEIEQTELSFELADWSEDREREGKSEGSSRNAVISVSVNKLDQLLDLIGELVIAEAMFTRSETSNDTREDSAFNKPSGQLRKITGELQDIVMSIRMVPLVTTFHKMRRVVRDMCQKLSKDVGIEIIGEDTELDKNIIDQISDPLMHLVRNALDHGIESNEDRVKAGKKRSGVITLEAKNTGGYVEIVVRDDGKGLNKNNIVRRAVERGLIDEQHGELTEKEIYALIFLPGFSTKDKITEFSGRGVGMDVVTRNIEAVGGVISVVSKELEGTSITMKIPLTLAIIDGMNVRVGDANYTVPTTSIKESFKPKRSDVITDPDGNEMIMVRGNCYPILRLHERFHTRNSLTDFTEGIFVMIEQDGKRMCLFVDELLGQQQVVVKNLPRYIKQFIHREGLAGCTLLGDGSISLILDVADLMGMNRNRSMPAFAHNR
ncbi:chemotaxis protein CheA [Bacillus sp. FJAT-26390]|uniref:chemotaxis protein CheA n=1 Tax=Bacillus sp. FJAT-26390 TaxID=1743142 RepID=UPI000807D8C9|nr:chemotaxis protein CheA [Bacillus sp. FJAT-26390]OBZ07806.1 chemotaxis protein CheA [Bacillus sp. FJAT-26390]